MADDLRREEFEAWLRSLPATAFVGHTNACLDCPLARWLQAGGASAAAVYPYRYEAEPGVETPLPQWAARFVAALDAPADPEDADPEPVTAAQALAVLHRFEETSPDA